MDRPSPAPGAGAEEAPILVVEDDPALREMMKEVLEAEGMRVVTAGDGVEAMEQVQRQALAAVILDLLLPDMDGDAVASWMRLVQHLQVPILLTSGNERALDAAAQWAGFPCLRKPFELADLVGFVRENVVAGRGADRPR